MKLSNIKDIVLVVAVIAIICLILFKSDPEPTVVFDVERSEQLKKDIYNRFDSLEMNVSIININAEDEKNNIDVVHGRVAIDSVLSRYLGFESIK